MKIRHLLLSLSSVLWLTACDSPPANGNKSPRGEQPALVETAAVQSGDISRTIVRNATLQPYREAHLSVEQEGVLLELPYHEGEHVTQGALLARLDDTLLRAQMKKSQAQRRQSELDLQRLKRLQSSRVVAEDELARAVTALDVARAEEEELTIKLQQTRLLAPFDGIVSQRLAEPGDALTRFSHLLTLIDTQTLYTELRLSELELPGLQLGDPISLTIDALGSLRFSGTIARIHPVIDAASRQGTVEVILDPPPPGAQPGQLCRVTLQLRSRERLLVPYNALRRDNRGEFLFLVDQHNKVARRPVVSGINMGEQVEILDGVAVGERIVTRGFLGLGEGSSVTLTPVPATP